MPQAVVPVATVRVVVSFPGVHVRVRVRPFAVPMPVQV
jgi:hypothetical protein